MSKFSFTLILFYAVLSAQGQDVTHNLSPREAHVLLESLNKKVEDTERVDILLRLASYNILKPGEYKADLDSAADFITKAKKINDKIRSPAIYGYISLIEAYLNRERGQNEKGKQCAETAIDLLKNTPDKFHLGQAYFERARYYDDIDSKVQSEQTHLVEYAARAFLESGHIELRAYTLKYLADLYLEGSADEKGINALSQSLEAYQSIHYQQLQGVYALYANYYFQKKDYKSALNYGMRALKTGENLRDTTMQMCQIENILGVILFELGEYKESAINFNKALKIAIQNNSRPDIYLLILNGAETYIASSQYDGALSYIRAIPAKFLKSENKDYEYSLPVTYLEIYTHLKRFEKAEYYCNQLLSIPGINGKFNKSVFEQYQIYVAVIRYYIASHQYPKAAIYLEKNKSLTDGLGNLRAISVNYRLWYKLDSARHLYRSALTHLILFHKINDSLFNETKSQQIKQMEVKYETEKKENEIKIKDQNINILKQKNQLQQHNLQQADLIKDITFGAILLLFIIIGLLYRQYRHKQKSNQVITQKNELLQRLLTEKEWLLKEVHHRVKNNLHTVICLLESQAAYLENDALKAIENSQHRIYAMSLIHQKLYQSDDVKAIDMAVYLPEFIRYLSESFDTKRSIRFQLDIEPLMLGVSQAIPLALIINEAVTNAIKYAFPEKKYGIIEITMHQKGEYITLTIADNGIGIDEAIANKASNSLGLKLMNGLSEDIHASINFTNDNGAKITLVFNTDPLNDGSNILAHLTDREVFI